MRLFRRCQVYAGLISMTVPGFAGPKTTAAKIHHHASVKHASSSRHEATVGMPAERATQIQSALIKQGYLTGEPTGVWDAQTVSAMQKLQSDSGWQSKITPDSRALIKLGLGGAGETADSPK